MDTVTEDQPRSFAEDGTVQDLPPEDPGEVERVDTTALDRAAELGALAPPTPKHAEFLTLAMEARILAEGNLVNKELRRRPHDVLLILLIGRDLGIAQTSALQQIYVVDGKPSLAPKLLNARLRALKLGGIYPHPENSKTWAAALVVPWAGVRRLDAGDTIEDAETGARRPLTPLDVAIARTEFTWGDAKDAGLVGRGCEPGAHADGQKCKCKDNWRKYPQRMLWWRCTGYAADDYYPQASLGLYTPDELGAVTDEDGQPIDVASVELPAGFDRGGGGRAAEPADPEALWDLQVRVRALPDDEKANLRTRWSGLRNLEGRVLHALPGDLTGLVNSLLSGCEAQARAKGWDQEAEQARVRHEAWGVAWGALAPLLLLPPEWPDTPPGATEGADAAPGATDAPEVDEPAPQWVQDVIDEVKDMDMATVDENLRLWSLPTKGAQKDRRARLAEHMVRDRQRAADDEARAEAQAQAEQGDAAHDETVQGELGG